MVYRYAVVIAHRHFPGSWGQISGTQTGAFREIKPTGNTIDVGGILIARVANAKIESAYSVFDGGDMLRQLQHTDHHRTTLEIFIGTLFERVQHLTT